MTEQKVTLVELTEDDLASLAFPKAEPKPEDIAFFKKFFRRDPDENDLRILPEVVNFIRDFGGK